MQKVLFALIFVILAQFFPAYAIEERSIIRGEAGVPVKEKELNKYAPQLYEDEDDDDDEEEYEDDDEDYEEEYVSKKSKRRYK